VTAVIRSSRVHEEPRVLVRAPRQESSRDLREHQLENEAGIGTVTGTEIGAFGVRDESLTTSIEGVEAVAAQDDPRIVDAISYDEYQSRFQQEIDALRAQTREEAYREGHAEGLIAGRGVGESEFSGKIEEINAVLLSAHEMVERRFDGLVDTAVEIVFESVLKILGTQFADKAGTEAVVREVVRQSKERSKLVVRVSPSDFEMLSEGRVELAGGLNIGQVDFVADDLIELGGCVLETPSGSLDGRLEIQLQRFRETLLNARLKWHEHGD